MGIDIISWLRSTGGSNAIKRFSSTSTENKEASKAAKAFPIPPLNSSADGDMYQNRLNIDAMKQNLQYNQTGKVVGSIVQDKISESLQRIADHAEKNKETRDSNNIQVTQNSRQENKTKVEGERNYIRMLSGNGIPGGNQTEIKGDGNSVLGVNGGQNSNKVNVSGDQNRVMLNENADTHSVTVKGDSNNINLGQGTSKNELNLKGNNSNIAITGYKASEGVQSGWKINVEGDNVSLSINGGKVTLGMTADEQSKFNIKVDESAKSVSIISKSLAT